MKICLGISGSIAAYRSVDFVKDLVGLGHEVRCVLTRGGREFVSARVLETFSQNPVLSEDVFDASHFSTDHISMARWADLFVVYGASANTLARMAAGFGDDFLSLQLLAFEGPVIVAPAMNPAMWKHPALMRNTQTLSQQPGYQFVGPIEGKVACGETGVGHLASHEALVAAVARAFSGSVSPQKLAGKKVLISAGPMKTSIDPVRAVQNRSSGKMGLELARACRDAGAEVQVLLGPVGAEIAKSFASFSLRHFEGPSDYEAILENIFPDCDIFFSAAAVLDFELLPYEKKIERKTLAQTSELRVPLRPVKDIVAKFAALKTPRQTVIAFAAETGSESEIVARATQKMLDKKADVMIANPVWPGLGPDADKNQVWILRKDQPPVALGPMEKSDLASPILQEIWGH